MLKVNENCGGYRGPSVAPQAEQHGQQVAEQLLGLVAALLWQYRGGNVIDDIVQASRRKTP